MNKMQIYRNLEKFQKLNNYNFKNIKLLITAFTHSSYINEKHTKNDISNERLEFLGDSILNFIISEYIYKNYTDISEGELTKIRARIVRELSLSKCAKSLNLGDYLLLGKGEEESGGRKKDSIMADTFEAVIAALFIDGGMEFVRGWVILQLKDKIKQAVLGDIFINYKSILQEIMQKNTDKDIKFKLEYKVIKEEGPDHDRNFYIDVTYNNKTIGSGTGKSKKEAEQDAAKQALTMLNKVSN